MQFFPKNLEKCKVLVIFGQFLLPNFCKRKPDESIFSENMILVECQTRRKTRDHSINFGVAAYLQMPSYFGNISAVFKSNFHINIENSLLV